MYKPKKSLCYFGFTNSLSFPDTKRSLPQHPRPGGGGFLGASSTWQARPHKCQTWEAKETSAQQSLFLCKFKTSKSFHLQNIYVQKMSISNSFLRGKELQTKSVTRLHQCLPPHFGPPPARTARRRDKR